MDKYNKIFDLVENSEKYTSEEISAILSETEKKEIYKILCKTSTVLNSNDHISDEYIDEEWARLNVETDLDSGTYKGIKVCNRSLSRAASVALIIFSSLAVLAVGISVSVSISDKKSKTSETEFSTTNVNQMVANCDTAVSKVNDQKDKSSPVIFDDTPLEDILKVVSEQHDVSVKFRNPA